MTSRAAGASISADRVGMRADPGQSVHSVASRMNNEALAAIFGVSSNWMAVNIRTGSVTVWALAGTMQPPPRRTKPQTPALRR